MRSAAKAIAAAKDSLMMMGFAVAGAVVEESSGVALVPVCAPAVWVGWVWVVWVGVWVAVTGAAVGASVTAGAAVVAQRSKQTDAGAEPRMSVIGSHWLATRSADTSA